MFTSSRVRATGRAASSVAAALVLAAVGDASWAATLEPVPVRSNGSVAEGAPTSHGAWVGWVQNSRKSPDHVNFFVQQDGQSRIRVNAAGTQGLGGGIVGRHVYYAQQFRDRRPRIDRFDLETGRRTPLPAKVNHHRHTVRLPCCGDQAGKSRVLSEVRGDVTASGPWLLYSGYMEELDHGQDVYYTVMLYNRAHHRVRTVDAVMADRDGNWAGQVNGRYATYWSFDAQGDGDVYRYDTRTGRTVTLPHPAGDQYDPAVSSDGTVYYFLIADDAPTGGPYTTELVRQRVGAPAEVVTTLTGETRPGETFVRDRSDGRRVVFFRWNDDVYKVVDGPPSE